MYPLNTPNRKEDIIVNTNISLKDNNIEQEIKNALSGFDIINKERKTYDFLLHDSAFRNLLKIETNDGFVKDMFATTFRTL